MIALLHPGSMGAAVGACLVGRGHDVGWLSSGRSPETVGRADRAGLQRFDDLGALLVEAAVVVSVVPPHASLEVARSVAGFPGVVVDANAVSPDTSARAREIVESAGGRYVDGGIIGPPPVAFGSTRLYLAGPEAPRVAALFTGSPLDAVVMDEPVPAASALKMAYAAWSKTTSALLVSIRAAAAALGVEDELLREWSLSQPGLEARSVFARERAEERGWRWAFELAEVGRTFASVGQPDGFGAAASVVFDRAAGSDNGQDP